MSAARYRLELEGTEPISLDDVSGSDLAPAAESEKRHGALTRLGPRMSARGELVLRIVAGRDGGLVTWLQTIRTDGIAVGTLKDGHLSLVDPGSRQHLQYRRLERVS